MQLALEAQEVSEIARHIGTMVIRPLFAVIVDVRSGDDAHDTIDSIRSQQYENWRVFLLHDGRIDSASTLPDRRAGDTTITYRECDYVVFVASGDRLSSRALYEFASVINASPNVDMIYADEDQLGSSGKRCEPFFKPDWSPDYLETFNYVGVPACFRTSLAKNFILAESYYDFVLRFTECTDQIIHVEKILCHRSSRLQKLEIDNGTRALEGRLRRTGRVGSVAEDGDSLRHYRIAIKLKHNPLVSIVIPTAGKVVQLENGQTDLILNCVARIGAVSTYKQVEIIIVDNGNLDKSRRERLEAYGCRFIMYSNNEINIAKKLNLGVSIAQGEMLLLLNDDTEPVTPDWIEQMLMHFEKGHVGVVGAKLLYSDDKIQHAGVVLNGGSPDHVRRMYHRSDDGYFFSTSGVRNFVAVTGACMMTPSSIYHSVGGYSEDLAISFNDVDYCMKVRALGYQIVYTPHAELYHFESKSRSLSLNREEISYFHSKWSRETVRDPFYNEACLTVAPPTFEVFFNGQLV